MSYNILKKNVKFSGPVSGTIEGMVDTSTDQTIGGQKTFSQTITSSAAVMLSGSGKVSASFFYGDGSNLSGLPSDVSGSNTQVQFNDNSNHGGSADFTFATGSSTMTVRTGSVEVLSASNYVSASAYYGDASNLTNVTADSILAQNIVGQLSASQISTSVGLTSDSNNLAVNLATNGGITDSSGLSINISNLGSVNWSTDAEYIAIDRGGTTKKIALTELEDNLNINASNIDDGTLGNQYLPQIINRQTISASIGISGAFFQGDGSGLTGVTGAPTPAGTNSQIQFNDDTAFAGDADLTFLTGSNTLATSNVSASVNISGSSLYLQDEIIVGGNTFLNSEGNIAAVNEITASSEISSSADVYGANFRGNGSTLTGLPVQTYSNYTANRLLAAGGSSNAITALSALTYNNPVFSFVGNISASINISGSAFYGDGSNLTNLPAGSPAGANTQIQFNDDGAFGASSKFTFATSSATLEIVKSTTTGNEAMIWFHSGSNTFGHGSGSFIHSDSDDDLIIDLNNETDRDIKFITRADTGQVQDKYVKLLIDGTATNKGVAIGNVSGFGSQDLYVSNTDFTSHTNIKFENRHLYDVILKLSSSTAETTLTNTRLTGDFKIGHDGGNIIFSSSVGPYAEFDSTNGYLFKATKLYYKEVSFQLATSLAGGNEVWLPMFGSGVDSTTQAYYMKFIAPFDGEIVKVMMRADLAAGLSSYTLKSYKASNATEHPTTLMETESIDLDGTANTTRTANFTTSTFSAGDILGFSLTLPATWSPASSIGVNATIVIAYDELS